MKPTTLLVLSIAILLTSSECGQELDPPVGNLKLTVTYPEVVIENDTMYWIQVPGVGAEARLYNKDARCIGYKDVGFGIAYIGDKSVQCKYVLHVNEKGEIFLKDILAGEYYLTVYARQLYKYTEKYIEVAVGDTLKLTKDFTPSLSFFKDLEPWDYEMPAN